MARRRQLTVMAFLILLWMPSIALADGCAPSRSLAQPRLYSSELAQLGRQEAAIRALEHNRQCLSSRGDGGLFNPCRDLANQRTNVQRQIDALLRSHADQQVPAENQPPHSCRTPARKNRIEGRTAKVAVPADRGRATFSGTPILYCVRLSDGYLFPAPHSQFIRGNPVEQTRDQCQYICQNPGIEVYVLADPHRETETMISLKDGSSYQNLPTAFQYRTNTTFERCDWNRYVHHALELQAAATAKSPGNGAVPPTPVAKPQGLAVNEYQSDIAIVKTGIAGNEVHRNRVRIVGPVYLPAEGDTGTDTTMTNSTTRDAAALHLIGLTK